jgi:hypothetical protein
MALIARLREQKKSSALTLAVPLLLVAVALLNRYLVHTTSLNPWTTGGFAMFSSVDQRGDLRGKSPPRIVRASADVAGNRVGLNIEAFMATSRSHEALVRRTGALPSDGALEKLGAALERQSWTRDGRLRVGSLRSTPGFQATRLHLTVWRLRYGRDSHRVWPTLVRKRSIAPE